MPTDPSVDRGLESLRKLQLQEFLSQFTSLLEFYLKPDVNFRMIEIDKEGTITITFGVSYRHIIKTYKVSFDHIVYPSIGQQATIFPISENLTKVDDDILRQLANTINLSLAPY